jgi:hypothetical protein
MKATDRLVFRALSVRREFWNGIRLRCGMDGIHPWIWFCHPASLTFDETYLWEKTRGRTERHGTTATRPSTATPDAPVATSVVELHRPPGRVHRSVIAHDVAEDIRVHQSVVAYT